MTSQSNEHPFAGTEAAQALRSGLQALSARADKISLREVGRRMGYKQPVVLSHMASGRIPVPVERAVQLATLLEIEPRWFVLAVLKQRYSEVPWDAWFADRPTQATINECIGQSIEVAAKGLSDDHRVIAQELLRDTHPRERWLSIPEIATVNTIREVRPNFSINGLAQDDRERLKQALGVMCVDENTMGQ